MTAKEQTENFFKDTLQFTRLKLLKNQNMIFLTCFLLIRKTNSFMFYNFFKVVNRLL